MNWSIRGVLCSTDSKVCCTEPWSSAKLRLSRTSIGGSEAIVGLAQLQKIRQNSPKLFMYLHTHFHRSDNSQNSTGLKDLLANYICQNNINPIIGPWVQMSSDGFELHILDPALKNSEKSDFCMYNNCQSCKLGSKLDSIIPGEPRPVVFKLGFAFLSEWLCCMFGM